MNQPLQSRWENGRFFASVAIMPSTGRSTATYWAPASFFLSSNITVTAHTISGLIWPLFTTIGMYYGCFITRAPHLFQNEKNLLAVASLCPIEDYWVSSQRLFMMAYGEQVPLLNWEKDSSSIHARFPSRPSQNCYKPLEIEFVRVGIANSGPFVNSMSSSSVSIASSILIRS